MNTFNNKPAWQNAVAVILGMIGIMFLSITWLYHITVQCATLPKNKWLNPLDRKTWIIKEDYPNGFCHYFCNVEATLINQLYELRVGFGEGYCKE